MNDDNPKIRPASNRGVPPCPKCGKADRIECHREGKVRRAVCLRCGIMGVLVKGGRK